MTTTALAPSVTTRHYPMSVHHAGVDHYEAGHAAAYADYAYDGGGLYLQAQLSRHPKYPRRQGYGLNHRGRRYSPTCLYDFSGAGATWTASLTLCGQMIVDGPVAAAWFRWLQAGQLDPRNGGLSGMANAAGAGRNAPCGCAPVSCRPCRRQFR